MTQHLTTEDHERWGALIELCLRVRPASVFAIQRAAAKCRARRGDKTCGATTPEGHRYADSCFWRLLTDASAYEGGEVGLYALRTFAAACRDVLAALPEPRPPKPAKPARWKRKSFRASGRKGWAAQNARWLNRADLNN